MRTGSPSAPTSVICSSPAAIARNSLRRRTLPTRWAASSGLTSTAPPPRAIRSPSTAAPARKSGAGAIATSSAWISMPAVACGRPSTGPKAVMSSTWSNAARIMVGRFVRAAPITTVRRSPITVLMTVLPSQQSSGPPSSPPAISFSTRATCSAVGMAMPSFPVSPPKL